MAYDVRVIPIREFMKTRITGELDLNASRDMLSQLIAACKRENMRRILIDCREGSDLSFNRDRRLDSGQRSWFTWTHSRKSVALLNQPKDDFDRAAFLELCAGNRGYHIRAFREFEVAFAWLVSEQASREVQPSG